MDEVSGVVGAVLQEVLSEGEQVPTRHPRLQCQKPSTFLCQRLLKSLWRSKRSSSQVSAPDVISVRETPQEAMDDACALELQKLGFPLAELPVGPQKIKVRCWPSFIRKSLVLATTPFVMRSRQRFPSYLPWAGHESSNGLDATIAELR